jgi:predicted PilT family ATPase
MPEFKMTSQDTTPSSIISKSNINNQQPVKKIYSKTIILSIEEQRRPALGEKLVPAEIATSVSKSTGAHVDMSSSGLTKTITMVVKGYDEGKVLEACRLLRARLAAPVKCGVEVPSKAVGAIVGKGGRTIKAIMQETGARITIPQNDDHNDLTIQITVEGSGDAVADAKRKIAIIVDEAINNITEHVELPGNTDFFLLGPPHNRDLTTIQSEFDGIKIVHVPGKLILSGHASLVGQATETLRERVMKIEKEVKQITTQVPKHLHKYLVGTKGSVLHHIEDAARVSVVIPATEDPSDIITMHGLPKDLVNGLQLLMEKTDAFHEEPIACPLVIRSFLLHKHYDQIKAIEQTHYVQFRQDPNGFIAIGKKVKGEAARNAFRALVQTYVHLQFDTVSIKKELIKFVIGKQGQGLKSLEAENDVQVIVEDLSDSESVLIIIGTDAEKMVSVKEAVFSFLSQIENEDSKDITIAEKYVQEVMRNLKSIQDLHPSYSINLSPQHQSIRIRGLKGVLLEECYQSVAQRIHQIIKYVDEHSFQKTVKMGGKAAENLSIRVMRAKLSLPDDLRVEVSGEEMTLKGRKGDVTTFEKKISDYLSNLADQESLIVLLDDGIIGKLIGRGGKSIATLYDQFPLVNVRIEKDSKQATLIGPSKMVRECQQEIQRRVKEIERTSNSKTITLTSPAISRLLFRQAEELNFIQDQLHVRISIDHSHNDNEEKKYVKIEGDVASIDECIKKLQIIDLEEHEETVNMTLQQAELLQKTFSTFYRQYTNALPKVRVSKKDLQIRIRGTLEDAQKAKEAIKLFLINLDQQVYSVQVILVDQRLHGAIIGQRGQTIKELTHKYDVAIDISRESSEVTVAGRGVEGCVEEIMKLTSSQ